MVYRYDLLLPSEARLIMQELTANRAAYILLLASESSGDGCSRTRIGSKK